MRTFFTADWHLGDPRLQLLGRPFATSQEMTWRLIVAHNQVVKPEDRVIFVGDLLHCEGGQDPDILSRINGRITLVRGNHDLLPDSAYEPYVEQIVPEGEGIEMEVAGIPCWVTHYPTRSRSDRFNLVAHVHAAWKIMPRSRGGLNVGVDVHHFLPVSEEQVAFYYKAIREVYDQDVWLDDLPVRPELGKPGSYLERADRLQAR